MAYRLRKTADNSVIDEWSNIPKRVVFPGGDAVHGIAPGHEHAGHVFEAFERPPAPERPLSSNDVNQERDRRMKTFTFNGKAYDFGPESITNIQGAGTLAVAAIVLGREPGDLKWADENNDFAWIANDNTATAMDAQTCLAFAKTAAGWRSAHIHAARALKDMKAIPKDFKSDAYWP